MRSHAENSLQSKSTDAPKGLPTLNVVILYAPKMQQFSNNKIWTEIISESSIALEPVIACFVMCNWLYNKIRTTMLPLFAGINVRKQLLKKERSLDNWIKTESIRKLSNLNFNLSLFPVQFLWKLKCIVSGSYKKLSFVLQSAEPPVSDPPECKD